MNDTERKPGRPDKPIPVGVGRALIAVVYLLTAFVAVSNSTHGYELASYAGQGRNLALFIAVIQDVMLAACITVLIFQRRNIWAWAGTASSTGFLVWSGVITSLPAFCLQSESGCRSASANVATRVLVALLPIVYAILLAGLALTVGHAAPAAVAASTTRVEVTAADPLQPMASVEPTASTPTATSRVGDVHAPTPGVAVAAPTEVAALDAAPLAPVDAAVAVSPTAPASGRSVPGAGGSATPSRERDLSKIIEHIVARPEPWVKADGQWGQNLIQNGDWSGLGEEKLSQRSAKRVVERLVVEGVSKAVEGRGSGSRTEGKRSEHTIASPTEMAPRPLVPSEPGQAEVPALHLVSRA